MPHRAATRLPCLTLLCLPVVVVLLLAGSVSAQQLARPPLPLPADEQGQVNVAIDRGVAYLLGTQIWGTWGKGKEPGGAGGHMVGYTALPALTLLECGIPPDHPGIKAAAAAVRTSWAKIDTTYELALSILFLDRLGDPRDKVLIETFALRLIAGQSPSGGWTYRCPPLNPAVQRQLLTVLRQLNPTAGLTLLSSELTAIKLTNAELKTLGRVRNSDPGPVERGILKRGGEGRADLARLRGDDKRATAPGLAKTGPRSPGDLSVTSGGSQWDGNYRYGDLNGTGTGRLAPRPGQCIKVAEGSAPETDAARPGGDGGGPRGGGVGDRGDARDGGKGDAARPPDVPGGAPNPARVVIPPALAGLPVLRNPDGLEGWNDPKDQLEVATIGTTDNSNTQFAILALWVAQRQGVPMERTMELVVRRFRRSQEADGGWGYRYQVGGGVGSTPAMTGVGLIGLAVGHGLAQQGRPAAGGKVQDPLIVNGFVALTRHVGDPAGRTVNLPMNNLYYLWSLERVAVLYNLKTIGKKDWYRWGAEILVANQGPNGEWEKGGYPGAHPVLDTCLALLFLRRANLASDLTNRLPFNPEQLNTDIGISQARDQNPAPPAENNAAATAAPPPTPPVAPSVTAEPETPPTAGASTTSQALSRISTGDGTDATTGGGRKWLWILLGAFVLLLLFGSGAAFWFGRGRADKEPEKKRRKGKTKKRRPAADEED